MNKENLENFFEQDEDMNKLKTQMQEVIYNVMENSSEN